MGKPYKQLEVTCSLSVTAILEAIFAIAKEKDVLNLHHYFVLTTGKYGELEAFRVIVEAEKHIPKVLSHRIVWQLDKTLNDGEWYLAYDGVAYGSNGV